MTATLAAVCAVHELVEGHSPKGRTAIDKRPLVGPAWIGELGVRGDVQYDRDRHGGIDQALYAYAREDARRWSEELGRELPPGTFGENLATAGVAVSDAVIGERWLVGAVLLEVTAPRTPCNTFSSWLAEPSWVRRFAERGDLGAYLRVLTPGEVRPGDPIAVLERPAHGVTVREVFTASAQEPRRLQRLLDEAGYLAAKTEHRVRTALAATVGRS